MRAARGGCTLRLGPDTVILLPTMTTDWSARSRPSRTSTTVTWVIAMPDGCAAIRQATMRADIARQCASFRDCAKEKNGRGGAVPRGSRAGTIAAGAPDHRAEAAAFAGAVANPHANYPQSITSHNRDGPVTAAMHSFAKHGANLD